MLISAHPAWRGQYFRDKYWIINPCLEGWVFRIFLRWSFVFIFCKTSTFFCRLRQPFPNHAWRPLLSLAHPQCGHLGESMLCWPLMRWYWSFLRPLNGHHLSPLNRVLILSISSSDWLNVIMLTSDWLKVILLTSDWSSHPPSCSDWLILPRWPAAGMTRTMLWWCGAPPGARPVSDQRPGCRERWPPIGQLLSSSCSDWSIFARWPASSGSEARQRPG